MSRQTKLHRFDSCTEAGIPVDVFKQYYADGYRGTACGYMRKNVQFKQTESRVTCFYCKREMARRSSPDL